MKSKDMRMSPGETREFFQAVGTVASGAHIFQSGVKYVDDVKFWQWFTDEVAKKSTIGGEKLLLDSPEAIREWVLSSIVKNKDKYLLNLLQHRGAEFDFVINMKNDPLEFLSGHKWRLATNYEDSGGGIDAVKESFFSNGHNTSQIKISMSDVTKRINLSKYMDSGGSPVDTVYVNKKIYEWRNSPEGRAVIEARGDNHPDVRELPSSDKKIADQGNQRYKDAMEGNASSQISWEGVTSEIARGAIVGAVVAVGISGVQNYSRYKRGEIDGAMFSNLLLEDSTRGALTGGTIAAINIPVQLAAYALNVGAPVTIPVMILVGVGIRKVIDPMFGRGEYAEILGEMEVTSQIAHGITGFAAMCHRNYEMQKDFLRAMANMNQRATVLNKISEKTTSMLEEEIGDI